MTDQNTEKEKIIEYLYGEMAPFEKTSFQNELKADPQLRRDLLNFIQLRQMVQEHLPDQKVPAPLVRKMLQQMGIRRPWYQSWTEGFFRPALVGAMVLALTLGVTYQIRRWHKEPAQVATRDITPQAVIRPSSVPPSRSFEDTKYEDMLLTNRSGNYNLRVPLRPSYPGVFSNYQTGRVSLVGYGPQAQLRPQARIPGTEMDDLETEAMQAVARFMHQQALRMRAMGEYKAAAKHLAYLIQNYPFYSLKTEAMAQRIDCLFKAGDRDVAEKELSVLRSLSPNLAYLVERRWKL